MASVKKYGWYLEGNQLALMEKDVDFDNNVNSKEFGPGVNRQLWVSPQSDVTDGLEIKYVYSPNYRINETNNTFTDLISYKSISGKLSLKGASNYDSVLDVGDYIILTNAGKFNGLHKITAFANAGGTNNQINLDTSYDGSTVLVAFEETVTMYYTVSILEDESFELDLPLYLQKALVSYLKAKMAEDAFQIEGREIFLKDFKKMIEKYESSRITGPRMVAPGIHSIK